MFLFFLPRKTATYLGLIHFQFSLLESPEKKHCFSWKSKRCVRFEWMAYCLEPLWSPQKGGHDTGEAVHSNHLLRGPTYSTGCDGTSCGSERRLRRWDIQTSALCMRMATDTRLRDLRFFSVSCAGHLVPLFCLNHPATTNSAPSPHRQDEWIQACGPSWWHCRMGFSTNRCGQEEGSADHNGTCKGCCEKAFAASFEKTQCSGKTSLKSSCACWTFAAGSSS